MISLKKLLDAGANESTLTLSAISLFLNATSLRAIDYDAAKRAQYQSGLQEICKRIERTRDPAAILLLAEDAAKLTDEYNRGLAEHLQALSSEKQSALSLVVETLLKICAEAQTGAQSLRFIERELDNTSRIQDVRALKTQMARCLDALSRETTRQEKGVEGLRGQIDTHNPGGVIYDPVTGLGGAMPAENYIRGCASSGQQIYVLPLVLKGLDLINRRYGYAAGDHLLSQYAATVASRLPNTGRLFRWRGPALAAVLPMPESVQAAQAEATRVGSAQPEYEIEQDGRSVFLKSTITWTVFPITRSADAIHIQRLLDAFVGDQATLPDLAAISSN